MMLKISTIKKKKKKKKSFTYPHAFLFQKEFHTSMQHKRPFITMSMLLFSIQRKLNDGHNCQEGLSKHVHFAMFLTQTGFRIVQNKSQRPLS